jgi:hypothetical protein
VNGDPLGDIKMGVNVKRTIVSLEDQGGDLSETETNSVVIGIGQDDVVEVEGSRWRVDRGL